jgi:hypothetical protein
VTQGALYDTSVFIARETGRTLEEHPEVASVSVVTIAELSLGVLRAEDPQVRAQRLRTLVQAEAAYSSVPITAAIARVWGEIVDGCLRAGRRAPVNDCWIAATARVNELTVVTQDGDYAHMGVEVIRV